MFPLEDYQVCQKKFNIKYNSLEESIINLYRHKGKKTDFIIWINEFIGDDEELYGRWLKVENFVKF